MRFAPLAALLVLLGSAAAQEDPKKRSHITIRGIYGGVPTQILEKGRSLGDYGVNAVFMGYRSLTKERVEALKKQGAKVYAEFNTVHMSRYLKENPDAAPVGTDGRVSPPPHGWQGVCPTHRAYRKYRMDEFRKTLADFEIDGIFLDYHHSHASWERAEPAMPDTCFCRRCLRRFEKDTGFNLPKETVPERARRLLGPLKGKWVQWRCDVFTDWIREFKEILGQSRARAILGTYHCPWSDTDYDGALRNKLAIDLKAQAKYIDVFSIMPYHARFGHHQDPAWVSRQTAWLGKHLGIEGKPGERNKIWPIVQLSDWGEAVPVDQVRQVLDHGTRRPATGVMVFRWGTLHRRMDKVEEMGKFYREIRPD